MCGRYNLVTDAQAFIDVFQVINHIPLPPRYDIAPGQRIPVVRQAGAGREAVLLNRGADPALGQGQEVRLPHPQRQGRNRGPQARLQGRLPAPPLPRSRNGVLGNDSLAGLSLTGREKNDHKMSAEPVSFTWCFAFSGKRVVPVPPGSDLDSRHGSKGVIILLALSFRNETRPWTTTVPGKLNMFQWRRRAGQRRLSVILDARSSTFGKSRQAHAGIREMHLSERKPCSWNTA